MDVDEKEKASCMKGSGFKVNLHITEHCNYRCKYCFAKYDHPDMGFEQWKIVINNLIHSGMVSAINLAGGEPLVHPDFVRMIEYIHANGLDTSFISNGTCLHKVNPLVAAKVSCLGISIDSFKPKVSREIGRSFPGGQGLDIESVERTITAWKKYNPKLAVKINTVVSKWNYKENVGESIITLGKKDGWSVDKWKILRAMPFGNVDSYCVSEKEFERFVLLNRKVCEEQGHIQVVPESTLEHAYIVVDNSGHLINNTNGVNLLCGSLLSTPFEELMKKYPLDEKLYKAHSEL